MSEHQLALYGREICPLCDQAAALLDAAGLSYSDRDIDDRIDWLARYRDRIPVLRSEPDGRELEWPFDLDRLSAFVSGR